MPTPPLATRTETKPATPRLPPALLAAVYLLVLLLAAAIFLFASILYWALLHPELPWLVRTLMVTSGVALYGAGTALLVIANRLIGIRRIWVRAGPVCWWCAVVLPTLGILFAIACTIADLAGYHAQPTPRSPRQPQSHSSSDWDWD